MMSKTSVMYIPNIDFKQACLGVLLDVDVDREMGVDISHLIFETLCNSNDQIIDDGLDSSKCSNVFACAMV